MPCQDISNMNKFKYTPVLSKRKRTYRVICLRRNIRLKPIGPIFPIVDRSDATFKL